ncbi:AAA family ATPase [Roseateles violae]|uniref:AAA family ATPase n=1 Tax=Roseateles violae TaxID=3058042 RepID=A0ABT8DUP4_9BURK|nr:AAA family ATPase [Pelomonas sp. PFR6]MDN3921708.1 AAA family ATPase [Pelomonas sp. PFR6]
MSGALRIAIVGAESTGKTALALALAEQLADSTGLRCVAVPELLRAWCEREGRTPRPEEQAAIAAAQTAAIDDAAQTHELVLCDTTALMTAIYSEFLFADRSLMAPALAAHRGYDLTLLTALDLPWQADEGMRDGAHVREPVDALIRAALLDAGLSWSIVSGQGQRRVDAALDAITPLLAGRALPRQGLFTRMARRQAALPEWRWTCDCDVPECEHAMRQRSA